MSNKCETQHSVDPIALGDCTNVFPEFGRFADAPRIFGLKRGFVYQLIGAGKIKSISLRKRGAKFGVRLIHMQSVRDFLFSQFRDQGATTPSENSVEK
jgi:hypothetical protein